MLWSCVENGLQAAKLHNRLCEDAIWNASKRQWFTEETNNIIAQEALERSIRKLGQFDPRRGTVENWLFRIVTNAAKDAGRVASRRLALWQRLVDQRPDPEADADEVEVRALDRLSDGDLLAAVRRLRPRERTVIALRFGADLDHASIGAAIGLSPNAARVAVRRALDRLRDQLQEENQ